MGTIAHPITITALVCTYSPTLSPRGPLYGPGWAIAAAMSGAHGPPGKSARVQGVSHHRLRLEKAGIVKQVGSSQN